MAEWLFRKKSKNEVERDPGWDEYFTSNRSTDESLVREAIQNSLDAHARVEDPVVRSQPAFVRFYYSGAARALPKSVYEKYLGDAADHYCAEDCKVGTIPEGDCPFVTIEDFNTTGLTGIPDRDYSKSRNKPPYYRFFWSENQSEKGEGTRGKWVQIELFKDRLTVFSPGPLHPDMKYEMLSVDHHSYATNPIIAHALYYVQYIEEIGSGTTDIFEHCVAQGLKPPIFDVDARHVSVTVLRPIFDDKGRPVAPEPITKPPEPITKPPEPMTKPLEPVTNDLIELPSDFDQRMASNRRDLRERAKRIWLRIARDSDVTVRALSQECGFGLASTQGALNALRECGLLEKTGGARNGKWHVVITQEDV